MIVVWNTIYIVNQRTGEISSRNWLSFICISLSICMVTTMRHICIFWITHRLVGDWPYSSLASLRMICFGIIFTGCFVNCKIMHRIMSAYVLYIWQNVRCKWGQTLEEEKCSQILQIGHCVAGHSTCNHDHENTLIWPHHQNSKSKVELKV